MVSSRSECSDSSNVGFTMNSPVSMSRPMRTQAAGPSKGAAPSMRAALAPMTQMVSGGFTLSTTSVVHTTCTSRLKPSTKPGRMGRSTMRAVSVPLSDGRASRFR